jgi:hypothetical protein
MEILKKTIEILVLIKCIITLNNLIGEIIIDIYTILKCDVNIKKERILIEHEICILKEKVYRVDLLSNCENMVNNIELFNNITYNAEQIEKINKEYEKELKAYLEIYKILTISNKLLTTCNKLTSLEIKKEIYMCITEQI